MDNEYWDGDFSEPQFNYNLDWWTLKDLEDTLKYISDLKDTTNYVAHREALKDCVFIRYHYPKKGEPVPLFKVIEIMNPLFLSIVTLNTLISNGLNVPEYPTHEEWLKIVKEW